jgi:scavenger receptor class B, member 1
MTLFNLLREFMEHQNVTFNDNGTVSYIIKRWVKPLEGMSKGNPKTDIVITPNIILLGASNIVSKHSNIAAYGFKVLSDSLNAKPILNITVEELLWGYEDKLLSIASTFVPSMNFKKFGFMDRVSKRNVMNHKSKLTVNNFTDA